MKLLIIAGPYEADRIRRAAVAAGFETVAVEPGESLSGWITASRPDLIVMAPQIVNPDPAVALAKVRSVPENPAWRVSDRQVSSGVSPPNVGTSSFVHVIGLIPSLTLIAWTSASVPALAMLGS